MSMISDLLKTPAEVREEELNKLRTLGQIQAKPLMNMQGQYSAAPNILGNWAGSAVAGLQEQTNKSARRLSEAGGQLARAAGGAGMIDQQKAAQLQELGRTAMMSGAEKSAEQIRVLCRA